MMKLDQLEYFVETAKRQHIGQAANFLHISPSAISHSIRALEDELGRPLFIKQGRQIILTPHGKILLEKAEFLLIEVERIRKEISSDQLKMHGHYRIAATHTLCSEFLTPVWINIQKDHPNLVGTLHSIQSGEVLSRVNSGKVDMGICFCAQSGPNYELEILHQGKLIFCFGKKHPFLKEPRLNAIDQYPYIASQVSQGIDSCENNPAFNKFGIKPKISNFYDNYDVAICALQENIAWTLLPDFLAYKHKNKIKSYIPRGWNAIYTIAAVWPKNNIRNQVLDCVTEKIRQMLRETVDN